jgi:hypothetical protein
MYTRQAWWVPEQEKCRGGERVGPTCKHLLAHGSHSASPDAFTTTNCRQAAARQHLQAPYNCHPPRRDTLAGCGHVHLCTRSQVQLACQQVATLQY